MPNSRLVRLQRYREARVRRVLTLLVEQPRTTGWTVGELAHQLHLETSQLHGIVSYLRHLGWLEAVCRRVSEHHGRSVTALPRVVSAYGVTGDGQVTLDWRRAR